MDLQNRDFLDACPCLPPDLMKRLLSVVSYCGQKPTLKPHLALPQVLRPQGQEETEQRQACLMIVSLNVLRDSECQAASAQYYDCDTVQQEKCEFQIIYCLHRIMRMDAVTATTANTTLEVTTSSSPSPSSSSSLSSS